jgi:hypothetical protein
MLNPWDRPPHPIHGDTNESILFEWVGRLMSQWEHIEWQLARVNAIFVGGPDEYRAIQEYGRGTIFRERLRLLGGNARVLFCRKPNQNLEGEFNAICTVTQGFADRRNEVAHGVVVATKMFSRFKDPPSPHPDRYGLFPPYSMIRNYDQDGFPNYAYTSVELNMFVSKLGSVYIRIGTFYASLLRWVR